MMKQIRIKHINIERIKVRITENVSIKKYLFGLLLSAQ